ncbi:MAG: lamin tail domain-containing protein [Sandaracinaceae bacterium]
MLRRLALGCTVALVVGCASGGGAADAGMTPRDAGLEDAGRDAGFMPRDAGRDSGPPVDAGPMDAGMPDGGPDAGPLPDSGPTPDSGPVDSGMTGACVPAPGQVLINEVMVASQSGGGDQGEWFELRNRGSCTVNLAGLVLEGTNGAGAAVTHDVVSGLLTAGGFFLLAQNGAMAANHALPGVDYVYGDGSAGITFSNSSDSLTLTYMGATIDSIGWGSTDHQPSESRQLDRGASASGSSIGGSNWCRSTAVYSSTTGGPFRGTPGAQNADCL